MATDGDYTLQPMPQKCKMVYKLDLIETVDENPVGLTINVGYIKPIKYLPRSWH